MSKTSEIRIDEHGAETHESWLLIRANHITSNPPRRLFDSEIPHTRYIQVTVARCTRRRQLNHDWLSSTEILLEMDMSQAQWGAFVSSFGQGSGVPATLNFLGGSIPQAPGESRFEQSHDEVRTSGERALEEANASYDRVMQAFETGGKRALREALRGLGFALGNAPLNMEFAAQSLTEHVEGVVTKARADIEGTALVAMEHGALAEPVTLPQLDSGATLGQAK